MWLALSKIPRFASPGRQATPCPEDIPNADHEGYFLRFQHIATELLSSDLPEIVQTCLANEGELLTPFFGRILGTPVEERNNVTVSEFCKVIKKFISHKPVEVSRGS